MTTAAPAPAFMSNLASLFSAANQALIQDLMDEVDFESFGKLDMAEYKKIFQAATSKAKLSQTSVIFVLLFCTMIKNKERIYHATDITGSLKANADFIAARKFIRDNTVQYVSEVGNTGKFPIVKVSDTFPSISVMNVAVFNQAATLSYLVSQSFFGHMDISVFLQDLNEMFMRFLWTQKTLTTKNKAAGRTRATGTFFTDIYLNVRTDQEPFTLLDGTTHKFGGANSTKMVTLADAVDYMKAVRPASTISENSFAFVHADWKLFHPAFNVDTAGIATQRYDYRAADGAYDFSTTSAGLLTDLIASASTRAPVNLAGLLPININNGPMVP